MSVIVKDMISMASAMFPEKVLNTMQKAEFRKEDLNELTREDIDNEFREFRFGIRKSLWVFFNSFKMHATTHQISLERAEESDMCEEIRTCTANGEEFDNVKDQTKRVVDYTSEYLALSSTPKPHETVPQQPVCSAFDIQDEEVVDKMCVNIVIEESSPKKHADIKESSSLNTDIEEWEIGGMQDVITTSPTVDTSSRYKKRDIKSPSSHTSRKRGRYKPTYIPGNPNTLYPGGIQSPFPLTDDMRDFLAATTYIHTTENKVVYRQLVREVYSVLENQMDHVPNLEEIDAIARNLCEEYPCLNSNGSHFALHTCIRKRRNCTQTFRKSMEEDFNMKNEYTDSGTSVLNLQTPCPIDLSHIPPYPLDLPTPFPLSTALSNLLRNNQPVSKKNHRRTYNQVVKAVIQILEAKLGNRPTLPVIAAVARNLCLEYPILAEKSTSKLGDHTSLYYFLRKCANYRAVRNRSLNFTTSEIGSGVMELERKRIQKKRKV